MIISKTPLRVSFFFSGGSDLPSFYTKENGAALSVTIDKFIYVASHETPYNGIRTMYETIEYCEDLTQMSEGITKEALSYFSIDPSITIATFSDILARGSGLGSSSSFTVGLIRNMLAHKKEYMLSAVKIAEHAFNIEANMCGYPVGKQDQYAAAYGGFNLFEFKQEGIVTRKEIMMTEDILELQDNLLLVYSGKGRSANAILQKQSEASSNKEKFKLIQQSRDKAYEAYDMLLGKRYDAFGMLLHKAWEDKKQVVSGISDSYIDGIYSIAMEYGSLGGKILGAGGGGFFIFYVPREKRRRVISELINKTQCKVYDFKFYEEGTRLMF